jgi:hypothetical protein
MIIITTLEHHQKNTLSENSLGVHHIEQTKNFFHEFNNSQKGYLDPPLRQSQPILAAMIKPRKKELLNSISARRLMIASRSARKQARLYAETPNVNLR